MTRSLTGAVALSFTAIGQAQAGASGLPWETPLQTITDSMSGPVLQSMLILAILISGVMIAFITDKKVIFARSLSIDKPRVVLPALMTALFLDITGDPGMKVPTQPERRERLLQEAIKTAKKPVVLFIDEAHDLHGNTLNGLKRLMEIVDAGSGILSIVLVGHPRLQNDLRRATMEEIGHRSTTIEIAGLGKDARSFIDWLLKQCLAEGTKPDDVISVEARKFLAEKLNTPLQIAEHLNRAFTDAFRMGAGSVTCEIVEETISAGFDDLDARLSRVG